MKQSFPDYHQWQDRDQGDESFWPSFTDIMMVITMVFLLVSVMVITNNWKLVTDLKTSIQAQRLAAEQALDNKTKSNTLEGQLELTQQRLLASRKSKRWNNSNKRFCKLSRPCNSAIAK